MAAKKKKTGNAGTQSSAKEQKKVKAAQKVEKKEAKKNVKSKTKGGAGEDDDQDLEAILDMVSFFACVCTYVPCLSKYSRAILSTFLLFFLCSLCFLSFLTNIAGTSLAEWML